MNKLGQKILLTLLGLTAAGLCYNPRKQMWAFKEIIKIWDDKKTSTKKFNDQMGSFYRSNLVKRKENKDGTTTLTLTKKGKIKALTYKFDEMKLEKKNWDGKWRVIFFDIPEKQRFARDILRDKIKGLGFCELQKSVFVFPYQCENEIEFLIENYGITKWVRFGILEKIDNDAYLKKFFEL
jgi:hypothetical protein